jgi:type IV pilus assembly protein PilB
MGHLRMGQLLEQMGKLSSHDIDEILHEQLSGGPRKPFGEIALTWGLCEPSHIWQAWINQLNGELDHINLREIGVDAQAVAMLRPELALRFGAVPVRVVEDEVVIAVSDPSSAAVLQSLHDALHTRAHFVLADAKEIAEMIARYYPQAQSTPNAA